MGTGGGLSTVVRLGLMRGGLGSMFGRGPGPLDRSKMGWSLFVPWVQVRRVF